MGWKVRTAAVRATLVPGDRDRFVEVIRGRGDNLPAS